jgi:hydroxymethylbilane synthase
VGGGCQLPLGAHCRETADGGLEMLACVTSIESDHEVRAIGFGTADDPEGLGEQVAERLLLDGAGAILEAVREYDGPLPTQE